MEINANVHQLLYSLFRHAYSADLIKDQENTQENTHHLLCSAYSRKELVLPLDQPGQLYAQAHAQLELLAQFRAPADPRKGSSSVRICDASY